MSYYTKHPLIDQINTLLIVCIPFMTAQVPNQTTVRVIVVTWTTVNMKNLEDLYCICIVDTPTQKGEHS